MSDVQAARPPGAGAAAGPGPGPGTGAEIVAISRGEPRRLIVLDSIRGIAALIVVVHHCLLTQPAFSDFFFSTWQTAASTPLQYIMFHTPLRIGWDGYEAVTFFYVLSGLVLTLPWAERHPPRYLAYGIKRVCRIYLPYLAAIAGAAVLNMLLIGQAGIPGASDWVNSMTWSNPVTNWVVADHVLMIGHHNTVNGVIHSLIWEMRVSLILPFLLIPMARWRGWGVAGVFVGLVALVIVLQIAFAPAGTGLALLESRPELGAAGKLALELQWTAYYAWFFVLGSLLALYLAPIRRFLSGLTAGARLGILVAGLLVVQAHWTRIHPLQESMVAIGSAMVIAAALAPGGIERFLMHRLFRFLGRISYSLYLVHVPLLLTAVMLMHRVPILPLLICIPPAAILLGWLFHVTVAEPCARLGQRLAARFSRRRVRGHVLQPAVRGEGFS